MENTKSQNPIPILKEFAKPYKTNYIMCVIFALLGVLCGLIPYFAVSKIILNLMNGIKNLSFYTKDCGIILLGFILKILFSSISTTLSHSATFNTLKNIRNLLIKKLSRLPMGTLLDTPSGKLKDSIVDRVESMEPTLAHLLPEMTSNILVPIILIIYLFTLDFRMALISLITLPIGMIFMSVILKDYPKKYAKSIEANKNMTNAIIEYINGIEVIKTFNQSTNSYKKYSDAVKYNANYFYNWMKSCEVGISAYTSICPAVLITILPIGFLFYINGSLEASKFITILILSLGIVGPIMAATDFVDSLAITGTIVKQTNDILQSKELIRPTKKVNLNDLTINLKNVSFSYHKNTGNVLRNINLIIKPGTINALVGPSGSGKSTIAKLIAGFWDITDGEITLGGFNLKNIPQEQLSDKIAYVSQDNYLFDDTIRENIRIGRKSATDSEIEKVAKDAGCDEFIRQFENGYDTKVGNAGDHLSGGEKQRIAIARAMLKNAPIVILDEATAYIDPENEYIIQKAVSKLIYGKTLIVIAHRLSTITDSDNIIVVKDGEIVKQGTHKELLKNSSLYNHMWNAHTGIKDGVVNA